MSTAAATMPAAGRQADHYTPSAERREARKQTDSYLSSQIQLRDERYQSVAEVAAVKKEEMAREEQKCISKASTSEISMHQRGQEGRELLFDSERENKSEGE